jgi:alkanesulfonate monooxygenase SsuD/methylene tetrahydromethanopterin reductase-like flavin-dependent oxidoreductase (luciferase family)
VEAEALGYDSSFVVEHHFTGFGQVSASLNLLTWVAARTSRLRLGTAVLVLPWHNPVLLAEQAATIDLLSNGRLEFGVGKGYRANEFAGFCIPMEEAEERFEEGLAVILKAWTSNERFSHHGKYLEFRECRGGAADQAETASADLDGGGPARLDPQGGAARLQALARSVRLDGADDRALQHLQG